MLALTFLASAGWAQTSDVALGIEALARRDVKGAEVAFRRGTTADNPLIRPAAWQWLGHVAWKFRGDFAAARQDFDRALIDARDSSQILLEMARMSGARRHYGEAQRLSYDAMLRSGDAERRGAAARTFAEIATDAAFSAPLGQTFDSVDSRAIRIVRDTLRARVERFHGRTSDALALVNVGAVLQDIATASAGLRSYMAFTIQGADSVVSTLTFMDAVLHARLYESFALFFRIPQGLHGAYDEAISYGTFLHDLRLATDQLNREAVAGRQRVGDATRLINTRGRLYWPTMHRTPNPPDYYPASLYRELFRRFATVISVEHSRGAEDLYVAHWLSFRLVDGAPIIILDGATASGIDDWILDGTGGRAGWVSGDTIYERRTSFTETPFRALLALTDPQTIPGELFRMARDSIGDIDRARRDSLGYFPGVAARMFRSGAQLLLDSVKTPEAFTRTMYDNLVQTTIVLHEGRHRADARANPRMSPAEAEFRAKLDEVTGAPLPRLALTAILSPTIGDSSPHGQANRRIMIGLNRWIRQNGVSIAGYDTRMPALLQLPLLTDAQLKAAFNSMRAR